MVSLKLIALFTLTSTFILSVIPASLQNECNNAKDCALNISNEETAENEKTDEWKENEWNKWKLKLEDNWKQFNLSLIKEKNEWIQNVTKDWNEWMQNMQHKWTHYIENMDESHKSHILEKSLTWNNADWENWVNTELKGLIDNEWQNWINQIESQRYTWIEDKWVHWRSYQILTWLKSDWKHDENICWLRKEYIEWNKPSKVRNTGGWLKWKERIYKQSLEWLYWVQNKEKIIQNIKCSGWIRWKDDKNKIFNQWKECFLNNWIREEKWNSLFNDKQTLFLRQ